MIALIAAMSENLVIGCRGGLPWHLPSELGYFQRMTMGCTCIMGRNTYLTLGGGGLPGRQLIVLSHHPLGCVLTVTRLQDALAMARHTVMICGGARIYAEALSVADRLYLSVVHCRMAGDRLFPWWYRRHFVRTEVSERVHDALDWHAEVWERRV